MSVENIAVSRAVALLNAAKVQYKIITDDGAEYGSLKVVIPKMGKRVYTRPRGEMRDYYLPHVQHLQSGGSAKIPFGQYEPEDIRGPLTAWCTAHWGNGSYITSVNRAEQCVEILRVE